VKVDPETESEAVVEAVVKFRATAPPPTGCGTPLIKMCLLRRNKGKNTQSKLNNTLHFIELQHLCDRL